jgi:hypothetical protein
VLLCCAAVLCCCAVLCCAADRSNACLRKDQSQCYPQGHLYYTVTRSGLDPMFQRWVHDRPAVMFSLWVVAAEVDSDCVMCGVVLMAHQ